MRKVWFGILTGTLLLSLFVSSHIVRLAGSEGSSLSFFEGFDDDFEAGRDIPDLVDASLSSEISAINEKRPTASGKLTIRDRDILWAEGNQLFPSAWVDFTDGGGTYITFRFDADSSYVIANGTVSFLVASYGSDAGTLFKYVSSDGVAFTQVGDDSDLHGTYTFPVATGGSSTFFRLKVGNTAGIADGVHVDNIKADLTVSPSPPPPTSYTLTITTNGRGTTVPSAGTHTYSPGTGEVVGATPDSGYYFDHWLLDGENAFAGVNPIPVMMNRNHTLNAVFLLTDLASPTYNLTISARCYLGDYGDLFLSIGMDGFPTEYTTPHTFINLKGFHTFTVPPYGEFGQPFMQWNTGSTSIAMTYMTTNATSEELTAYYLLPPHARRGAHVDEHWWKIISSHEKYQRALLTHEIDAGSVPYPESLEDLQAANFTITKTSRLGQNLLLENNRVWPLGTENGSPSDPEYWRTVNFRKAIHRLISKDELVALHAPLTSRCDWWLPPGHAYWINSDCPLPTYNPIAATAYLDTGGFVQGTTPNPDYDPTLPWSSAYMRIDPLTGEDLSPIEYYAVGSVYDPAGFEMAKKIESWLRAAGIPVNLIPGSRLGMTNRLTNSIIEDYQLMSGVNIFWGTLAPSILYDLTYSWNLPLWNLVAMDIPEINIAGLTMMSTFDLYECRQAAWDIQMGLAEYEPYLPLLIDNGFSAFSGPYGEFDLEMYPETEGWEHPGAIGIVNAAGFGGLGYSANIGLLSPKGQLSASNVQGKRLGRADRFDPERPSVEINKWGLMGHLDNLNPFTANTEAAWQVLAGLFEGLYNRNPYTLEYMWWGAQEFPTIEYWVGPGREHAGGDGVYDAPFNGTHYNSIPVDETTPADMEGDDQVGMVTTWTLRPGMYWHDSDPGPDGHFDTLDDGVKYPVTAEDFRFALDLLKYQNNSRYFSNWWFIHCVAVVDDYTVKVFEEQRFLFAFEGHNDVALLAPKHIWEPWINPTIDVDACECKLPNGSVCYGNIWTYWQRHHEGWYGWEEPYVEDPQYPGEWLTHLIGCGPFNYHLGGWEPGVSAHISCNKAYFGRCMCIGDIDSDQKCEIDDWHEPMISFGEYGDPNYRIGADICYPAGIVNLDEVYAIQYHHFGHYWGPDPVEPGFIPCPGSGC